MNLDGFAETLVILILLSLKKMIAAKHLPKYSFIKDLISQWQENKKKW